MTYSDIPRLLTMTIFWQLLLVWYLLADRLHCGVALGLLVLLTLAQFISGAEMTLTKRRMFLDECLEPRTALFRVFQRRYLLLVLELLKSVVLSLFLMVSVLGFRAATLVADVRRRAVAWPHPAALPRVTRRPAA